MDYVFSVRSIRQGAFIAEPGASHFLAVPAHEPAPTPDHVIRKSAWVDAVFEAARHGQQNDGPRGDILFYIHGFNTPQEVMLTRHRKIRAHLEGMGFEGVVVSFDWPAANMALNYLEDRLDAKMSAFRLVTEGIASFARLQRPDCFVNLHLIAHSTGAYVVREAFDDADDRPGVAAHSWSVSQVMLISADVSSASLAADSSKSSSLYRHCVRLTNYHNPFDNVLSLSDIKRIGVAPRAGRIGIIDEPPQKAIDINCGPYFDANREGFAHLDYPAHTWWFEDALFMEDVLHTIRGAVDRREIPTRIASDGGTWLRFG
ncbi:alpha/beta hydrolase [Maritalea mobilis]|uniref:alpha/beta hydrolase n=1 Tax=Maritalea mobilis TaxID=483324 RepID=UPI001C965F4E|nr:alpha/beta hydrolase [Maritalea mobilis]MBY6202058.1 alpha/beta hydrolase [Maritalea mobilis]